MSRVRLMIAGATGAVGRQLVAMVVEQGHEVYALSRTTAGVARLDEQGAIGVQGDVLDAEGLSALVAAIAPAAVINEVTDLAGRDFAANAHARRKGTRNLVDACLRAHVRRMVSQSIAGAYAPGRGPATEQDPLDLDAVGPRRATVDAVAAAEADVARVADHVALRYGLFYGPGTWFEAGGLFSRQLRDGTFSAGAGLASFVHVVDAAAAAVAALDWPSGVINVVDDDPAPGAEWADELGVAAGVRGRPELTSAADWERGADNAELHRRGFELRFPTWSNHLTSS